MEKDSPTQAEALLERYLSHLAVEKNLSVYTRRNYATDLRHLFAYLDEREMNPLAITRTTFRGYLASMMDAGTAQASIARRVSTARSFFRWLRLNDEITADPLANVSGPKQARRLPHTMSLEDITNLIAAADGERPADLRDRALLELMYASGLRVSEAAGLDVNHVDLEQMAVLVHGKGNKERMVVMGEPARAAVERYLKHGRGKFVAGAKGGTRTPALFLNRSAGRMSQRRIQILVRTYALKAGIDARVHPHLLRHTVATHLLDGGAELRVVQELMGHSSPNTTQIYLHVTEERSRKAVDSSLDGLAEVESARREARNRRG
jgi:site-specific recombinase XerD